LNFLFAWRYFKSKKSTNAINIIAWITVVAMAVGTGALVIILSAFNGFEGLVKSLYTSFYPDIRVTSAHSKVMVLDEAMLKKMRMVEGVEAISLVAEENAHLQNGEYRTNAVLKGVDTFYSQITGIQNYISNGKYNTGNEDNPAIILGSGIENALNLMSDRAISPVTIYLPKKGIAANADPLASISSMNFQPQGAFAIQQDFDNKYVLTNLDAVKLMIGLKKDEFTAAEIKIKVAAGEKEVLQKLQQITGTGYLVENRYQQNRSLFSVMQLEKWAIYGILSLILIIASFNMIGALTMLVLEKQQDVQILKAMGATNFFVQKIFLTEGVLLAFAGGVIGIGMALLLCYLQTTFHFIPLQGAFVIDYYPVKVLVSDLLLVLTTVFFIAVTAAWVPSKKAAKQKLSLKAQ
jgi:lipoprotein-releasing system permease protein